MDNSDGADVKNQGDKKTYTINTVQHSAYIKRLAVERYRNYQWYIPYDLDNLYPNKIKAIAERSTTTSACIVTHSDFLSGLGFGDDINKIIINREGWTLEGLLKDKTADYSEYKGCGFHFNYNRLGVIVEINEIPFEGLRWAKAQAGLYYSDEWDEVGMISNRVIKYNKFNPAKAIDEINEVGIENYNGQVLYFIPKKRDIYTVCRFDMAVNDAQYEDEATIGRLRGIQNDYAMGGIIKLPMALLDDEQFADTKDKLQGNHKGAKNTQSWALVPAVNEDMFKGKMFEPNVRQNIDRLTENQENRAEANIFKAYQMPPILCGVSKDGMFNQDQFADAFDYYNTKTEDERTLIEKVFNMFWPFTEWYNGKELEILPKEYISRREGSGGGEIESDDPAIAEKEALKIKQEAQAKLKGTASGTESLLSIQQSVKDGVTTYAAALTMLDELFGFDEETAKKLLGEEFAK
jgi:hypothetical protein